MSKKRPFLSIVTPSYNQGEYIQTTLDSILQQNVPTGFLEYIVCDNMSTDCTFQILKNYRELFKKKGIEYKVFRKKDSGQSNAINFGWKESSGNLLTYLNSDDYYVPNKLHSVIDFFQSNKNVAWGYGGWRLVDSKGRLLKKIQPSSYSYQDLLHFCNIGQPSCFFRKDLIEKVGSLNEKLGLAMDYDLWLRFSQKTDAGIMPFIISNMRYHSDAKSTKFIQKQLQEMLMLNTKYTSTFSLNRLAQYYYFIRGTVSTKLKIDTISLLQEKIKRRKVVSTE